MQRSETLNNFIPVLITLDVHSYPETEKELPVWLEESLRLFDSLSIKVNFFFPAIIAERFKDYARMVLNRGHEIGCHGLRHELDEQYSIMPFERQKAILCEAKKRIEDVLSSEVISFRSPIFKINGNTIKALEENGFKLDSSVNSQRLGLFSSDIANIGWMYSPRRPYHPSLSNPFIKGKSVLWEIPLSAFILPFMSNTGIAFGRAFLRLFYKMLYMESCLRKNPIVYMFHPEDIYPKRDGFQYKFEWRHLLPSRKTGFKIRDILYHNKDSERISSQTIDLLNAMRDSKNIRFFTFKEMLSVLNGG